MRNYLFLINETINYIVGYSRMKYLYKGGGGEKEVCMQNLWSFCVKEIDLCVYIKLKDKYLSLKVEELNISIDLI